MALNFLQNLFSPGGGLDGSQIGAPGGSQISAPGIDPPPALAAPAAPSFGISLPSGDNALQGLNVGATPDAAPPQPQPQPQPQPSQPAQPQAEAPRGRHSLLDTVGRLADVFAKVGGAEALYQPTLDARQDRALKLTDHATEASLKSAEAQTAHDTVTKEGFKRVQLAVKGAQAIREANPNADLNTVFPALAQRVGIPADEAAQLAAQLSADPSLLKAIGATDDKDAKYSGAVVLSRGPDGKIHAFQPNLGEGTARDILPAGYEGNDPTMAVNTGDRTNLVGKNSGKVETVIQNGAKPDTVLTNSSRERIGQRNNQTALTIAGMPARAKAPADGKKGDPAGALATLDNIQKSFDNLHGMNALPGEGGALNNVIGTLGRTALGQSIGARTGLSSAAQERELLAKNLGSLQSEMIKSLPGSATRTKFEQEIQKKRLPDASTMNYATARTAINQIRQEYQRAQQAGYAADSGPAAPATRQLPPRIGGGKPAPRIPVGKPTVSNW